MPSILLVNPLKPGKLESLRAFIAEFTGPRESEYQDFMCRYGLKTTQVHYYEAPNQIVMVMHELTDDAFERLAAWPNSTHLFDLWFKGRMEDIYELDTKKAPKPPESLLSYAVSANFSQ